MKTAKQHTTAFAVMALLAISFCGKAQLAAPPSHTVLPTGWQLSSAQHLTVDGSVISQPAYDASHWYPIHRMPATVLEVLQEDGVYPNLYFGMNLLKTVPQDLYKQAWWYRATFSAPADALVYRLGFPGIDYRADIWLNGHRLADSTQVAGMYVAHELDASQWIHPGALNVLATKVIPEQKILGVDGVELADSWHDWINWKYLGFIPPGMGDHGVSMLPVRNAGVWKPVSLDATGPIALDKPLVNTALPLPAIDHASLTLYATARNLTAQTVNGSVNLTISRAGRKTLHLEQRIQLGPREVRELTFDSAHFPQLHMPHPDLWWPYTMGRPDLYNLDAAATVNGKLSDANHSRFGIRVITQHRDTDEQFPALGKGGSFYLTVNGKDFLVRGAVYTPDLLYKSDPARDAMIVRYVKNMGLNMLRWESKIAGGHMLDLADQEGIPVMMGWMCCAQWEHWKQWDAEDYRVAGESLRSQITMLRGHASAAIWANGSDGLPPPPVLNQYHRILHDLHWQNAVVDTVSSLAKDAQGNIIWSGIHMRGPYTWRPPAYWFSGKYGAARGACAEQGDNEHIPTFEGLKKFIPQDKLWPINEDWYFHAGANRGNSTLENIQRAITLRYGAPHSAEDFSRKAQLAEYEDTRAQFESFAAGPWADHKMTLYWMLNNPWPSFFGQLFDDYLQPGGGYFGAKKGLRPLSIVFDSFATGDHSTAHLIATNQTAHPQHNLRVRVRIYDLQGAQRYEAQRRHIDVPAYGSTQALTLPRPHLDGSAYFVRCDLLTDSGKLLAENAYWQSTTDDDLGPPKNDRPFSTQQLSWADFKSLSTMPRVPLVIHVFKDHVRKDASPTKDEHFTIHLQNRSPHVAFFERAELTATRGGDEILPILYDDNYVTLFPGESMELHAVLPAGPTPPHWLKLTGYNTDLQTLNISPNE